MRLLFNLYNHLTEVVLPELAIRYGWNTCNSRDIQRIICANLGMKMPAHCSRRYTTTRNMKRLVQFCYDIIDNPLIFLFLQD